MKALIVYRILSFVVNFFCLLIALEILMSFPVIFSNPSFLLPFFLMVALILYGWFSNIYFKRVYVLKTAVTKKLKDWVQVNAIVTLLFCLILAAETIVIYQKPQLFLDALKNFSGSYPLTADIVKQTMLLLSIFALIILAHVIWTLALIRKNRHLIEG